MGITFGSVQVPQLVQAPQFRDDKTTFIDGMMTMVANGNVKSQFGGAIHLYVANTSMVLESFVNADADMVIVPQEGALKILTEFAPSAISESGNNPKDLLQILIDSGFTLFNLHNKKETLEETSSEELLSIYASPKQKSHTNLFCIKQV